MVQEARGKKVEINLTTLRGHVFYVIMICLLLNLEQVLSRKILAPPAFALKYGTRYQDYIRLEFNAPRWLSLKIVFKASRRSCCLRLASTELTLYFL